MPRHRALIALFLPIALFSAGSLESCSGADSAPAVAADAGTPDAPSDAPYDPSPDVEPLPDAATIHCKLDNGGDPVGLCIQKLVLRTEHEAAFVASTGVASSWNSKTFAPDTAGGKILHDVRDDVGYAASIARYHHSSGTYGDNEITALLDADLIALVPHLEAELATLPAGYDGALYAGLRWATAGLRYLNQNADAAALDAIAEAYARRIVTAHYVDVTSGDAGAGDWVIGDSAPGGGASYAPAEVANAALALLDMAVRHAGDEAKNAAGWQLAAVRALDHLWLRARDPATGMYFRALDTSGDPDHDALSPTDPALPADALLVEVQAEVALALLRAQDLVHTNPAKLAAVAAYPFEAHAEGALTSIGNAKLALWDAAGNGYMEGWIPSTSTLLDAKPTRANALLFAAIHRANLMGTTAQGVHAKALRALLLDRVPPSTSLLSVLPDQNGYLLGAPKSFAFDPSDAGPTPHATSYRAAANAAVVECLTEQWFGQPQ